MYWLPRNYSVVTIAYDNHVNDTGFGGNVTMSITPVGTPRGVWVGICQGTNDTDTITGVTYGGTSMTRVHRFVGTAAEHTVQYVYFLGSSIPTGAQDAVISTSSSTGKHCIVMTLTAADDTEINTTSELMDSSSENDPRVNFAIGGVESFVAEIITSGFSQVTNIDPITGWTDRGEGDMGALVSAFYSYDTIGTADVSCGFDNTGSGDDAQILGIAINEVTGGGGTTIPVIMNQYARRRV
jgi:hypothetical protein